jgi:hypothetical protein
VNQALRRVHRAVQGILLVCALVIVSGGLGEPAARDGIDRIYSVAALGLAAGSILLRRSAIARGDDPRVAVGRSLGGLILSAGLGILGVVVAMREGAGSIGLLYTLAGGFLSLRPPVRIVDSGRGESGPEA